MTADGIEWKGRTWWLVGASAGLGRALAHEMSRAGATLILSARDSESLMKLVSELPGPAQALPLDIADQASVDRASAGLGPVDGIVFLAGVYWPMAATAWTDARAGAQVVAMCDVNFTGAARALGAVLPGMLARGRGHIVITGSLSGFRGLPGAVGYGASKAAVMSLAETLRADLAGSGILVQLANPGYIRTRLTDKNDFSMPFIMEPDVAARHMFALMQTRRFSANFPRLFALMFRAFQFLPDWAYFRIIGKG